MATVLKRVPDMEKVVQMLENRNEKGEVQGISDTAGRALLAGTLLLEYQVAADLVVSWKTLHPPLLPIWVRKVLGLGFDKTTQRGKEDKDMFTVLGYYMGAQELVNTYQMAMEHIQYDVSADGTRLIKGGELEMRTIN